jgi:hypothetical protein
MPIPRYSDRSIFSLWPGAACQALNTSSAVTYPAAMFSPIHWFGG